MRNGTLLSHEIALAALATVLLAAPARAAEPPEGTISTPGEEASWRGGPFVASNPAVCVGALDPTCDHFILRITAGGVKRVLIAIAPDTGFEADDYDLFVYDDRGILVASNADGDGYESVVFEHRGSSFYEVRVQPFLVSPGSGYGGVAMRTREQAFDVEDEECLEPVPATLSAGGVTDTGQRVELAVMLLLDGTDAAWADQVAARAKDAYAPLGIDFVVKRVRRVSFTSTVSSELIDETQAAVGGERPGGIDVVCTFTNKEMQSIAGGATVVGQADCIGGVRFANRAFCVVSDIQSIENPQTGTTGTLNRLGFNPNVDATAEVMAHEIGHLMGAHHHYANCLEGNLTSGAPNDLSPCTLMFNAVNFASINFSLMNSLVVRGHTVDYASP